MVFSSLIFLYGFLPVVLIGYFLLPTIKLKNIFLTITSLIFYAWGEPKWVVLLILTGVIDYTISNIIEINRHRKSRCKKLLILSITLNLGFLFIFKYSGFVVSNLNSLLHTHFPIPKFNLPIGISFYTFQTMSYTIDVYRNHIKAQKNFLYFLMCISFFFHLVAGPIVRYSDIQNQVIKRKETLSDFYYGINRFLIGLFKKVVIANYAGQLVENSLNGNLKDLSILGIWLGVVFYAIQIYFDFSGYSDMAIGLARMLGFRLLENFNYPYISKSMTEFWRRWHISLGSFFRDYLYIPLGGNKKHQMRNICIVWFLTGLWHGASWNFIFWGLYFAVILVIEKFFLLKVLRVLPSIFSHVYALFLILVGWVLFYYESLDKLLEAIKTMFGFGGKVLFTNQDMILLSNNYIYIIVAVIACTPIVKILKKIYSRFLVSKGRLGVISVYAPAVFNLVTILWCTASLVGSTYNPFIYFRF